MQKKKGNHDKKIEKQQQERTVLPKQRKVSQATRGRSQCRFKDTSQTTRFIKTLWRCFSAKSSSGRLTWWKIKVTVRISRFSQALASSFLHILLFFPFLFFAICYICSTIAFFLSLPCIYLCFCSMRCSVLDKLKKTAITIVNILSLLIFQNWKKKRIKIFFKELKYPFFKKKIKQHFLKIC